MKIKARVGGKAIVIEWPNNPVKLLVVEIDIDCPECGQYQVRVMGHHLRAIRDLLIEFIDLHPELTGTDQGVERIESSRWEGRGGGDPTQN